MSTSQPLITDWTSSPSASIVSLLEHKNMSLDDLSERVGGNLFDVVTNCFPISENTAEKLEEFLGGSAEFWLRRDKMFQEKRSQPQAPDEKEWARQFPYAEIAKLGWLPKTRKADEKLDYVYDFFNCDNLLEWNERYKRTLDQVAFRTSFAFENDSMATLAWLRKGEQIAENIKTCEFNVEALRESVPALKGLCRKSAVNVFLPQLQAALAKVGVSFVVVRAPKGCRASGATRFVGTKHAVLQMSFRYLTDDHFWFTLFHEIGHLLLHRDTTMFLEGSFVDKDQMEQEANQFSADVLIPRSKRHKLHSAKANRRSLIRLAFELKVSPGILVGQMQHEGILEPSQMNFLKRRYSWG